MNHGTHAGHPDGWATMTHAPFWSGATLAAVITLQDAAAPGAAHASLVRVHETNRAGNGVLEVGSRTLAVTLIQRRLLEVLLERRREDVHLAAEVAGYCPSAELIAVLPWDTSSPTDANLKALVSRLRGKLRGWPLRIEARQGLGYRLGEDDRG